MSAPWCIETQTSSTPTRELVAIHALQGILSSRASASFSPEDAAEYAIACADALVARLNLSGSEPETMKEKTP